MPPTRGIRAEVENLRKHIKNSSQIHDKFMYNIFFKPKDNHKTVIYLYKTDVGVAFGFKVEQPTF